MPDPKPGAEGPILVPLPGKRTPETLAEASRFVETLEANRQIARELGLSQPDVQLMTEQLRHGLAAKLPPARLEGEVEIDEVYVVAGHKGQPAAVAKRGVPADAGA